MTQKIKKRGPGRPKGSKNKVKNITTTINVVKRGRGRPAGSKNKVKVDPEFYELPHPNPKQEWERIDNIRHMVAFYQNPDGTKKVGATGPKKRGRKSALENFDPEKLLKEDLDTNKLSYKDEDVADELGRLDAFKDMSSNRNRYSDEN